MRTATALHTDLALALDPSRLMAAMGCPPDAWQQQVLRSQVPRILLNCSRQSGKSTTVAALALHKALYAPGSLVLLLSASLRQSQELFRKVQEGYRALDHPAVLQAESALRYELANGSRILSLPGTEGTVRGYSGVDLLVIDEAARVDDELYYAIRPMLAVSGGRLVALSTPFGARGWFYQEYMQREGWQRVEVNAYACPRISRDFLEEEQRSMPPLFFRSEYLCEFVDTLDQVFPTDLLYAAMRDDIAPLWEDEV